MFDSPIGAVIQSPQLTGKVFFGITSKYSGSSLTGHVNMNFRAANLDFASTSTSLLVTSGSYATLRAVGTLNGVSGYTVLVTGIDGHDTGGSDFVRFQIKDFNGVVIYDTQPGSPDTANPITPVAGQIIVH